ncbi:polysaccharide transporter, PST family [Enhydrobacter aerosaccus]|uniref:Polysaccharide transporter, PST family n=2 Tax=Enhydrobacter aerosaccus TaxID=225324 RepID=A0A1T4TBI0_9HYPH|nr:polysaccharide transporter, PST family [Enhydrobacter aerosaccus]
MEDVGRRSRRGGAILLSAQGVRVLGQMGTLVVLARLLPPTAFGLLAMVAAIGAILDLVKEFGLSAATIQKQDITQAQVSALFWINAGVGLVLGLGLFLSAPLLARFYEQPELADVARCMSLGFVASGLTVQHWALLRRQMRFSTIAGLETVGDLVSFAAGIGLAVAGAGYWALVVQRLCAPLLLLAGSWLFCRWRPAAPRPTEGVRGLLSYGASVTGSQLAVAFARSIDQILIGWLWGPAVLGLYERTTRLLMMPVNTINAPIYAAAMPGLSRLLEQPARYRTFFAQVIQKLGLLTMPPFALAAVTADWVVEILFGPSWAQAVPLVALFSLYAVFLPVLQASGLLYLTQARTTEMLRANLIDAAITVAAILAGLYWGVTGVALALTGIGLVVRLPLAFWLSTRHGPVGIGVLWRAVAPPASAAIAVVLSVSLLRRVEPDPTLTALASTAAVALTATLLALLAWPETRREIQTLLSTGKIPRPSASG